MASLNKVTLIGNLGKDPELRYTKSQMPFARFSLATTERFTSQGEQREKTEWHNIVVWGKQAEIAQRYLHKGKQVYIEGRLEYRDYEDQSGQKRYITDIKCDRFLMLGRAGEGGGSGAGGGSYGGREGGGYGGGPSGGGGGYDRPMAASPTQGGGGNNGGKAPMSYGEPMNDVPESDDFNDDDIPF
jgi:single-strand DNA-binding protein